MRVRVWGTRGSLPTPGPATVRYGGDTSCVEVRTREDRCVVLDAGTGIRRLGDALDPRVDRIDILLSHLHLDHIIGLGFFAPLFRPDVEVHIWGPSTNQLDIRARLTRYLSQPLFPVRLDDLPCRLELHDVPTTGFDLPGLRVRAMLVCHPGPTVGYRLEDGDATLAYLPDHEPSLCGFPGPPEWTSGYDLADGVDLLIHDAQYTVAEYADHVGWGHSSVADAVAFAVSAGAGHLVPFHHDPAHTDEDLDAMFAGIDDVVDGLGITPATPGMTADLSGAPVRQSGVMDGGT